MSLLNRLFSALSAQKESVGMPPPAPDAAFFAIGDIHGRDDLLARLLDKIAHAQSTGPIICVGDYIDRGEDSAGVLRRLMALGPGITCLMGNHEDMLIRFLDMPAENGARWLRNGGLQTMASFGIGNVTESSSADELTDARDRLRAAMGEPLERWLRALPTRWQSGNVAVVHAGADPALPLDVQTPETLIWGHPDFAKRARADGIWIVHGHTMVDDPVAVAGRISIDTGAYATGRLTAAHVAADGLRFLQA